MTDHIIGMDISKDRLDACYAAAEATAFRRWNEWAKATACPDNQ
ncbi:hypothetical protein [Roseovarius pacificus]|nr:hypothetical protein [Roseovarius pacificus]